MKRIIIEGNQTLKGEIKISGAKNSAVALIPTALLSDGIVKIDNVPNISDIDALEEILVYLGAKVTRKGDYIEIDSSKIVNKPIPEKITKKLRASYYFMSCLLAKFKSVEMCFPGGCNIGTRPIDQTLKAFKLLGAKVDEKDNKYKIVAKRLVGNNIYLDMPSVGATINAMLVAVKSEGKTNIYNAAREPEIVSIATFLNQMGAKILGAGTNIIEIQGVSKLGDCFTEVIPDRIEAGTYLIAGALVGNNLKITNIIPEHIKSLTDKMLEMGCNLKIGEDYAIISAKKSLKPVKIKTLGYPGFATDLQQPITALLVQAKGMSTLEETIYENRFNNVKYLNQMGADITIEGKKLFINGPKKLKGANVVATDLRAGACMVLAALSADGITTIDSVEHVLRGYENLPEKLTKVGAKIKLEEI